MSDANRPKPFWRTWIFFWVSLIYILTMFMFAFFGLEVVYIPMSIFAAMLVSLIGSAYVSIFFKEALKHDPDHPNRLRWFLEVEEKHATVIDRSGTPISIIRGGDEPSHDHMVEFEPVKDPKPPKKTSVRKIKKGKKVRMFSHRPETPAKVRRRLHPEMRQVLKPEILSWQVFKAMAPKDQEIGRDKGDGLPYKEAIKKLIAVKPNWLYDLFKWYQGYVFHNTGLYVYLPYFTEPKVLPLQRYRVQSIDGVDDYKPVEEGMVGFHTNHVRIAPTNWYFIYKGVDIDGIPFTIRGSLLYRIQDSNISIYNALYKTNAWNSLLDQATSNVVRAVVRSAASIDAVIGKVDISQKDKDIWKTREISTKDELYKKLSGLIFQALLGEVVGGDMPVDPENIENYKHLVDYGIEVFQVFITDFEPELSDAELRQLRAPTLGLQEARKRDLVGVADASAQSALLEAHKDGGDASERIINADALVRASKGGGLAEALLAVLLQNSTGGKS